MVIRWPYKKADFNLSSFNIDIQKYSIDSFNHFRTLVREVIHLNEINIFQIQIKNNSFS